MWRGGEMRVSPAEDRGHGGMGGLVWWRAVTTVEGEVGPSAHLGGIK